MSNEKKFTPHPKITKEEIQQYEKIRVSGVTNMFDIMGVAKAAQHMGYTALLTVCLNRQEGSRFDSRKAVLYKLLIKHYSEYIELFKIERGQ